MATKFLGFCTKLTQLGSIKVNQPYFIRCLACNTPLTSVSFNFFSTSWKQRNNQTHLVTESNDLDVLYKRITLELKGHDAEVINSYEKFTSLAANELDVEISKITTPKRSINRYTQLKSVHIFKKHRVQYEARTHYRIIELKHLTGSTADTYLEYIERNLPEGMAMKVTRTRLETIPDHIKQFIEPKVIQSSTDDSLT